MAVERIGVEVEPIPRRGGGDGVAAEELAEVGDVELDQLRRRRRCTGFPESLAQLIHRHDGVRTQEERQEEETLLRRA